MFEHYGYLHTVFEMCNEDYTKIEYWEDKSFIYFLNLRCHWKDWREEKMKAK